MNVQYLNAQLPPPIDSRGIALGIPVYPAGFQPPAAPPPFAAASPSYGAATPPAGAQHWEGPSPAGERGPYGQAPAALTYDGWDALPPQPASVPPASSRPSPVPQQGQ
jgi:hypothetical protein